MVDIKIFEPGYDKQEFYGYMGDPLTMPEVKKELPYLSNTQTMIWFLAFAGDELAGFGSLDPSKTSVNIRNMYVYPAYRGNKIGQKILDAILKYAKRFDLPIISAVSNEGIVTAFKNYEKLGFVETKRTKNYTFIRRE